MKNQKGFTLLEVLIVVVIAVSVVAFSVPAYKKTQDRNRFMAAQGVLIDLGNGLRSLQEDLSFPFPTGYKLVASHWQNSVMEPDVEITASNAPNALFARRYMSSIPYDSGSNAYKGYTFYICPENTASTSACCQGDADVVACMMDASYASRPTKGQYYGAVYYTDGSIKRITK